MFGGKWCHDIKKTTWRQARELSFTTSCKNISYLAWSGSQKFQSGMQEKVGIWWLLWDNSTYKHMLRVFFRIAVWIPTTYVFMHSNEYPQLMFICILMNTTTCVLWRMQGGHWSGKRQGNLIFLQGQGKVREFCKLVRELLNTKKVREKSGNFKILAQNMCCSRYFYYLKYEKNLIFSLARSKL